MTASLFDQFSEMENGALRSIDLSRLYRLCQTEKPEHHLQLAAPRSTPTQALARLQQLLHPLHSAFMALVPRTHGSGRPRVTVRPTTRDCPR